MSIRLDSLDIICIVYVEGKLWQNFIIYHKKTQKMLFNNKCLRKCEVCEAAPFLWGSFFLFGGESKVYTYFVDFAQYGQYISISWFSRLLNLLPDGKQERLWYLGWVLSPKIALFTFSLFCWLCLICAVILNTINLYTLHTSVILTYSGGKDGGSDKWMNGQKYLHVKKILALTTF